MCLNLVFSVSALCPVCDLPLKMPRDKPVASSLGHFGELVGKGVDHEFQAIGDAKLPID